jgi:hypothetical protein
MEAAEEQLRRKSNFSMIQDWLGVLFGLVQQHGWSLTRLHLVLGKAGWTHNCRKNRAHDLETLVSVSTVVPSMASINTRLCSSMTLKTVYHYAYVLVLHSVSLVCERRLSS